MDPAAFQAFTDQLIARLSADPDVVGLVGLGSTSGLPPHADAFSDHDFFVVVKDGAQERFRVDRSWLPEAEAIVLSFRETAHGLKTLWRSGHLAEYAVFSPAELSLARVNRYRVFLDRGGVEARMAQVRAATVERGRVEAPAEPWTLGMFLADLVIGAGRWARGERLSGHQLVRAEAVVHLATLLRPGLPPERAGVLDDLSPLRRIDAALGEDVANLLRALTLPAPAAARALLHLLEARRPGLVDAEARAAVERVLDEAERSPP